MKIAIVQDELIRRGGAERVVLCFHHAFPDAPIYTSAYRPNDTYPEYKECDIRTSWFDKIVKNEEELKQYFFPLGVIAMKMLDLTEFDVIIQCGTHCSKYVKVHKKAVVFTYCFTPFRLAWNPRSYLEYLNSTGLKRVAYNILIRILRKIDKKAAQRTDFFIGMTDETAERIRVAYDVKRPIKIIPPSVSTENFFVSKETGDYYFILSRLEFYKKVDLVINAFNKLNKKLIIVGKGSKEEELKSIAGPAISFRKGLPYEEVAELYSKCKAFLMPQHEDYGITPLEANASGRPVIAYAKGGVLETMIPYKDDAKKATALFFDDQTEESLIEAINRFETLEFDSSFIRKYSENYDDKIFTDRVYQFVMENYKQ
jgi:glycosyltransferase involved in cell wall biosynthesis